VKIWQKDETTIGWAIWGNTYPVCEAIKAEGGFNWNKAQGEWCGELPDNFDELSELENNRG
jgi:hypothetical protein